VPYIAGFLKSRIARALRKNFILSLITSAKAKSVSRFSGVSRGLLKETNASFLVPSYCFSPNFSVSLQRRLVPLLHRREERLREKGKEGGVIDGEDGFRAEKDENKKASVSSFHSLYAPDKKSLLL
jgi:hypothetical protein